MSNPIINEDDYDGLWPPVKDSNRTIYGVAYLDPEFEERVYTVRVTFVDEQDARRHASETGGLYVTAEEQTEIIRYAWSVRL